MTLRAPGRRDRRGAAPPGRHAAGVADRPDGDRRDPGHATGSRRSSRRPPSTTASRSWVCPPRRPQRKGVVEKAIQYVTRSWWRTAPVAHAGAGAGRPGPWARRRSPTGASAGRARSPSSPARRACSRCRRLAFPAQLAVERECVGRSALVAFEGNHYSVSPGLVGQTVTVRARLGELHAARSSPRPGDVVARHRRAPAGAGQQLRSAEHAALLEQAVLDAFTTDKPCRRKANRPPGDARAHRRPRGCAATTPRGAVVVDLEQLRADRARSPGEPARHLPAAARAPALPQARRRRRPARPPRSSRPSKTSPATPSSCTTCSTSRSTRRRNAASPAGCGFAGFPSTKTLEEFDFAAQPSRSIAGSSTTSRRCGSSRRRPTSSLIGPPGVGKTMLAIAPRPARPSTPATASTTPPPPTSSPAPAKRRARRPLGRPRCASGTDRSC